MYDLRHGAVKTEKEVKSGNCGIESFKEGRRTAVTGSFVFREMFENGEKLTKEREERF